MFPFFNFLNIRRCSFLKKYPRISMGIEHIVVPYSYLSTQMLPACFILIHSLSKTRAINNFSKEGRKKSHLPPLPATSSTFFCLFHRLRPPLLFLPFPLSAPSLFPFIPAEADYIQVMRFPGREEEACWVRGPSGGIHLFWHYLIQEKLFCFVVVAYY